MPSGAEHIAQMSTTLSASAQWAAYKTAAVLSAVMFIYLIRCSLCLWLCLCLCLCCTLLNWRVKKRADIAISCVGVVVVVAVDVSDFVVVDVVRAVWPPLPNNKMCIVFIAFVYILHANV